MKCVSLIDRNSKFKKSAEIWKFSSQQKSELKIIDLSVKKFNSSTADRKNVKNWVGILISYEPCTTYSESP